MLAVSEPCSTGKEYKDANKIAEKLKITVEINNPDGFKREFRGLEPKS
jgi:hypothetical protein